MSAPAEGAREQLARLLRERAEPRSAPLTPAQRRLWFLEQLDPGQPTYHIPTVLRLDGRVDAGALERALRALVRRHEALRVAVTTVDGEPWQRVVPDVTVPLARVDLPADAGDAELDRALAEQVRAPFDLSRGPLLRATLLRAGAARGWLAVTVHHLAADGWSLLVLGRELRELYGAFARGRSSPLGPPPVQYLDYATWLHHQLEEGAFDRASAFWLRALDGAPPWLDLPVDRPRAGVPGRPGAVHRFAVGGEVTGGLRGLLRTEGATPYMGLLAAFAVLLHRLSGQPEVVVGSPVANRGRVELEQMVGLCANVVPVRVDLRGEPGFRQAVRRVREAVLASLGHQDLPFERLVEVLRPERDLARNPVFQVLFTLQSAPIPTAGGGGAPAGGAPPVTTGRAQFDLTMTVAETAGGLRCSFEYATGLFDRATIERMAARFRRLLAAAARDPDRPVSRLPLLGAGERALAVARGRGEVLAAVEDGPSPLVTIAGHARADPDAPALVSAGGVTTRAELEAEVAGRAARLRAVGVRAGDAVVVCAQPGPELVVALLAVLRAGGTYVPVAGDVPAARLAAILRAVAPAALLAAPARPDAAGAGGWLAPGSLAPAGPPVPGGPAGVGASEPPGEARAYVVFTSGSSGTPKGVAVSHAAVAHHARAMQARYPLGADDTVLLVTGAGFDASVFEVLGPLSAGARLAMPPPGGASDPAAVVDALARHRVTAVQVVPSLLQALLDEPGLDRCRHLRRVYCGGETLTAELQRRFHARSDAELLNMYGPTETTVDAMSWRCSGDGGAGPPPIGRPIPGVRGVVVDRHLEPVPDGVTGELLVGGPQVAHGYVADPALTAARFVPDPFGPPGSRAYLTGDRARRRSSGAVEFAGRGDRQVKLRGVRVDLGEVEAALRRHPGVVEAAAAVRAAAGTPQLAAAVVLRGEVEPGALRRHLLAFLPAALLPAVIEPVPALPAGPTGKVDHRAVEALLERAGRQAAVPPRPGAEQRLAAIWQELLGVGEVGRSDSFFELGGHSLLATQLASRVRAAFGADLPLRRFFADPTVAGIAAWLESPEA